MAFLDGTVVNVALPVMHRQLGISVDLAQWGLSLPTSPTSATGCPRVRGGVSRIDAGVRGTRGARGSH
jgi:hypothetical protein